MDSVNAFNQLYRSACAEDRSAQDGLVRLYWVELGAFVERITGPTIKQRVDPEDLRLLALETFLRRLPTFPKDLSEDEVRARLFQIAKWSVADVCKREQRETPVASWGALANDDTLPSRGAVTQADDRRMLRDIIGRMKPEYADVLRCSVLEGLTVEQAAAELGITEENARKRLLRAKKQLLQATEGWRSQEAKD